MPTDRISLLLAGKMSFIFAVVDLCGANLNAAGWGVGGGLSYVTTSGSGAVVLKKTVLF